MIMIKYLKFTNKSKVDTILPEVFIHSMELELF